MSSSVSLSGLGIAQNAAHDESFGPAESLPAGCCRAFELLRTNAANIHTSEDWCTLFTLLECVGAGTHPPAMVRVDLQEPNDDQDQMDPLDSGKSNLPKNCPHLKGKGIQKQKSILFRVAVDGSGFL